MLLVLGDHPLDDVVAAAGAELEAGRTVVLPTDTVYGVAAAARNAEAVQRLVDMKGRDASKPIAVLVAGSEALHDLADEPPAAARRLAHHYWPGALTIVVRRSRGFRAELGGDDTTIGIRCPDSELVRRIAARVGPLATTSANRSGEPTPERVEQIEQVLPTVSLVIDAGTLGGAPSTVVDCTGEAVRIIRAAAISEHDLHSVLTGTLEQFSPEEKP